MRATSVKEFEKKFLTTSANGEFMLRKIHIGVPGEDLFVDGFLCTSPKRSGYYYDTVHPKERIVIHYTAGTISSDIPTLTTTNRHVSVPFVIARDGTIYQLFSSKFWSGHIGKGLGNTNTGNAQDKCSIAIELSNYGFLTERDENLETCYSRQKNMQGVTGPIDIYCSLGDEKEFVKLPQAFRQEQYYAAHTAAQYNSLITLLRYLTAQYNIPRKFLPEAIRYQTTDEVLKFKGIVSHVNYRPDGKWDIGPAFNWEQVINGVQTPVYKPTVLRSVSIRHDDGIKPITSEDENEEFLPAAKDRSTENESYDDSHLLSESDRRL